MAPSSMIVSWLEMGNSTSSAAFVASPDPLQRFLGRARRALGGHEVTEAVAKVRAVIGLQAIPAGEEEAQSAWDKLRNGDAPGPEELAALEIVIRLLRPALLSHAGVLDDLPDQQGHNLYPQDLKDQWSGFRDRVKPLLYSIGCVNLKDGTQIGTGFLVADGVLATNRHVLDDLTFGTEVLAVGVAQVIFQREDGATDKPEHIVEIAGVINIHRALDMVLLAVPKLGRPVVDIDSNTVPEGHRVAAIGYPAKDEARNPIFAGAIFKNKFGVKRAAVGEVLDGTASPNLFHDCSTLGGNSGSPLFSLETGKAVGIHRAGFFMYRNEAVDGDSLHTFVRGEHG
jgi:S1-C subfamily serine protease